LDLKALKKLSSGFGFSKAESLGISVGVLRERGREGGRKGAGGTKREMERGGERERGRERGLKV
jgi:hypothetical protein